MAEKVRSVMFNSNNRFIHNPSCEKAPVVWADCLLKWLHHLELLQEAFIGFCSDVPSMMLGTNSGFRKLLKDKFPDIILWHCLNHKLELAVGNALNIISGINDFQAFLQHLYSLYSKLPKNKRELGKCSHDLQMALKKIGKVFTVRLAALFFWAVSAVWHSFPALSQHFPKLQMTKQDKVQKRPHFKDYYLNCVQRVFLKI